MNYKVKQTGNTAGRDVVGRDKYEFNAPISPMTKYCMEYIEEKEYDQEFKELIPELQHYMKSVDVKAVIGLEEKLKMAGKLDEMESAARQKELVAKRLNRHSTSRAAQKIYTYVLGEILSRFNAHIKPLISKEEPDDVIGAAVFEYVLKPTMHALEHNVLDLFWEDMWGLVYYLTGNCHIKWTV